MRYATVAPLHQAQITAHPRDNHDQYPLLLVSTTYLEYHQIRRLVDHR